LGLLLGLSAGALAFVAAPGLTDYLSRTLPNFPKPTNQLTLIMTVILFVIFALIGSLIVAASMPRKKSVVTEVGLIKDRKVLVTEKKARKIRQQQINREGRSR
jgi:short subunit fatty acids transporter